MKNIFLYIITMQLAWITVGAQVVGPSVYVVKFTDKNNSPFSINTPLDYLTQRAIDRRINQNISLSVQDFPLNSTYVNQVAGLGAQVLNRSKWLNAISVFCTDTAVIQNIQALPFVQSITAVKRHGASSMVPKFEDELAYSPVVKQKNSNINIVYRNVLDYGPSFGQVNMIGGTLMHAAGFLGSGKVIAVIDAGFYNADLCETFDSAFINNQILGTWDFVDRETNVYNDNSHGTYVLSTIAGYTPGSLIGTAPKASFWLLRSEDAPTEYIVEEFNWVCAAEFADSVGADIINSSLGYTTFDNTLQNHTYAELDGNTAMASIGASIAASKGIIVCNSAGNSGENSWLRIGIPADADHILTVGAVDSLENVAPFSSRGHSADGRIKPDLAAQGVSTVGQNEPGIFAVSNGTSFSSPLIAGMCASLWEALPNLSAAALIQKIKESCDQYANPDSLKGYGIPDFAQVYMNITGKKIAYTETKLIDYIAPNPFTTFLKIRYFAADTQTVEFQMFDMVGNQVAYQKQWCDLNNYNYIQFNLPATLAPGMYFMKITNNKEKRILKLIRE